MARAMLQLALASALVAADSLDLPQGRFSKCDFEIVMMETRPLGEELDKNKFWAMNIVSNKAYADRFGYHFVLITPELNDNSIDKKGSNAPLPSWYKVPYLQERLSNMQIGRSGKCSWLLYMDSNAYVRESDVPLPLLLEELVNEKGMAADVGGIFSHEPGTGSQEGHILDTAFFLQANTRGSDLLEAWRLSAEADEKQLLRAPAEEGTLTELLMPRKYKTSHSPSRHAVTLHAEKVGDIGIVDSTRFAGREGSFIELHSTNLKTEREAALDELTRLHLTDPKIFNKQLEYLKSQTAPWTVPKLAAQPPHAKLALVSSKVSTKVSSKVAAAKAKAEALMKAAKEAEEEEAKAEEDEEKGQQSASGVSQSTAKKSQEVKEVAVPEPVSKKKVLGLLATKEHMDKQRNSNGKDGKVPRSLRSSQLHKAEATTAHNGVASRMLATLAIRKGQLHTAAHR
eukprot:gb/GFBE01044212.1/.p1 GENE.gb/GFBE01044212.1/~~gb/GFBE01044212.1/.p1  ORF type:complete len:456 (+),score=146.59 gb/GFBE01044212.1/:1-1368(+)